MRQAGRLLFADLDASPEALAMRDGVLEFIEPSSGETVFKAQQQQAIAVMAACLEFLVEALVVSNMYNAFEASPATMAARDGSP